MSRNRPKRARGICLAALATVIPVVASSAYGAPRQQPRESSTVLTAHGTIDRQVGVDSLVPADACPIGMDPSDPAGQACSQQDTTVEPAAAVDPEQPGHLLVAYQEGRRFSGGATALGYAVTFDGGRTWTSGDLPFTKPAGGPSVAISDPSVAFGRHGDVYVTGSPMDATTPPCPSPCSAGVIASHDGGRTWSPVVTAEKGECFDRGMVTVDTGTGAGHHPGRVYLACNAGSRLALFVMYSDDGGKSWVTTQTNYGSPGIAGINTWPVGIQVMPNGDLWVLNQEGETAVAPHDKTPAGANLLTMLVYPGAGATANGQPLVAVPALPVADNSGYLVRQVRDDNAASMALNPRTGVVHVCWANAGADPTETVNDIVCSSSTNALTWTTPLTVTTGPTAAWTNRWNAAVSVAPNGRMVVAWRQRQEAATEAADGTTFSPRVDTMMVESTDDGASFAKPRRVGLVTTDIGFAAVSLGFGAAALGPTVTTAAAAIAGPVSFLGDFLSVVATDQSTYVVRSEPVRTSSSETAQFPARYHHQRVWVAQTRS